MKVTRMTWNLFGENTYFIFDEQSKECFVIDPGMMTVAERKNFDTNVAKCGYIIKAVILTHIHIDHAYSAAYVAEKYNVPIYAGKGEAPLGASLLEQALRFHLKGEPIEPLTEYTDIDTVQNLSLGGEKLTHAHIPGHSPDSILIYAPQSDFALVGDVIFMGSIGRTDLLGGDFDVLANSIRREIYTLPPTTMLLPGHGDPTSVETEMEFNPFVRP